MSAMVADAEGGSAAVGGMHEGIIQTSSPFYKGDPSSRIWVGPFFRLPDPGSQFGAVDNGSQSPSPASSFVTAPSAWGGEVAKGDRNGAVPVAASPASSSTTAFLSTSSLFVSASSGLSSASSGFSSASSAFSSPASLSSSASSHAGGSGSTGSPGLSAGKPRRHSGRRDSGSVARPPVGAGMGVSSAKQKDVGPEGGAFGGNDPLQNIGARLRVGGGFNAGEKAGNSAFKAVMKDSAEGNFGDSGFRFNSGNWKSPVESVRGGATFRFGSENAMPSGEGPAPTGFRFGSKVAKAAEEVPAQRVSAASPLSFTTGNVNSSADSSVASGFARLSLSSDEISSPTRASAARPNVGGFVFGAGNLNMAATPTRKGSTDPVVSPSSRPSVRRDDAFLEAGGETTRTSFKFNHGSGFPAQRNSAASHSSTASRSRGKEAFTEDASSSFSRFPVEFAKPSAGAFQAGSGDYGSNVRLESEAVPAFRAFPESLKQTSVDNTSVDVDEKFAECSGETDPDLGDRGRFVRSRSGQKLSPSFKGGAFSAPAREGNSKGELQPRQGAFVFGADAGSQQDQNASTSLFSRTRRKVRKDPPSAKGKGLAATPSEIFAHATSPSTSSSTHGESFASGQDLERDTISNFEKPETTIFGTGRSGDVPLNDEPKPASGTSSSRLNNSARSSESDLEVDGSAFASLEGTATWNSNYADMLKGFKRYLGIYDDDQNTDNQDLQSPAQPAVHETPSFEFQVSGAVLGGSPKVNAGPFVFGSTKPVEAESQQRESPGKRRKGKVHSLSNTRKFGKSSSFKQDPTSNTDERSPSPMDFSPRDEEAMEEEDDALKSLRTAAGNLSIGKDSILEEVSGNQQYFTSKSGLDSDGSAGLGKSGKRVAADASSVADGVPLDNSAESSGGSSNWAEFVFSAGSSQTSPGVQRRHARKTYREKGPEIRKFVRVKGQAGSSDVDADRDESMAEDFSVRLILTGKPAPTVPMVAEGESSLGSSSRGFRNYIKVPRNATGPFWNETTAETSTTGSPPAAVVVAAEQACEKWRLRGNQAYESGDFSKAEECYSRGAGSVSSHMTSQSCVRALTLCYSNRAATRMAVGRMRDAIGDCLRAMAVDPKFLRVRLRLANCYLSLGEIGPASTAFKECVMKAKEDDHLQDSKTAAEAAEGLKKTQLVQEYTDRVVELLTNSTGSDVTTALRLVTEALKNSQHSENLLELKTIALIMLRKYEDAEQLSEQTLAAAERNFAPDVPKSSGNPSVAHPYNIWRWKVVSKCKFHLGKLEEALEYLKRIEESAATVSDRLDYWHVLDMKLPGMPTIRDLLRHKAAGNEAFQVGRHAEAVEQYTAALACSGDSRPFNAVCLCNRAAASQALGHIADAIADCSRAVALDPKYAKAISRRATLHESVRDFSQSVSDLQRLVSLLESQHLQAKGGVSRLSRPSTATQDLNQARERLNKAQEELRLRKKDHALDHYLILGVDKHSTTAEIKKAYRKAALRHHPDKAGQFVVWNEGGDETLWREICDEVRHDAERLFKLIGEAHAVLSDQIKRNQYDKLEEAKKIGMQGVDIYADCARSSRHHHDASHRYEPWSGYSHQYQRWQSGPDAAQPDTYARRGRNGSHTYGAGDGAGNRAEYDWDE